MAEVVLRDVRKSFDNLEVIHGANLAIEEGQFIVFVGPSGCGKSTLLRLIAGLENLSAGEILIGGKRCNDLPPSERGIAMVFQSYALYPHMSVYDNMAFALKLARFGKDEIRKRVMRAADILQIQPLLERKPKALSGGQRQRVAIGRAIVREPQVFLFDEPLSNLDAALRVQMRIEIAKLHRELATTIIYVTHDQVEAMTMATKIVVLNEGNIEQFGVPLELYHYPANQFVAGFIGSPKMNFLPGTLAEIDSGSAVVTLPGGERIRAAVDASGASKGDAVTVGIRPEHFGPVPNGQAGSAEAPAGNDAPPASTRIRAKVSLVEHLGEGTLIYLQLPGVDELIVCRAEGTNRLRESQEVNLDLPVDSVHLFGAEGQAFKRLVDFEL